MARTKGGDEYHAPIVWHRQEFRDHAGRHAVRLCKASEEIDPFTHQNSEDEPPFYFQVYTIVNLEQDAEAVARWLTKVDREPIGLVIFDFYEPLPDPFECVEHSRREVRYRIARWREQTSSTEPWNSDLIPKSPSQEDEKRRDGLLIVLTGEPPRVRDDPAAGAPYLVNFNRTPQKRPQDIDLLSNDPAIMPDDEPNPLLPERLDMRFWRQRSTSTFPSDLYNAYTSSFASRVSATHCLDYGLDDEDPDPQVGSIPNTDVSISESFEKLQLSSDVTTQALEDGSFATQSGPSAEPLLRYRVFVPFLVGFEGEASLEQVARAFTAAIVYAHPTISFHLQFIVAPQATLASVLDADRAFASSANEPMLGTLVSHQGQQHRVCPWYARNNLLISRHVRPTFAIVLEAADFVGNARIAYLTSSMDQHESDGEYVEMEARRPVDWDATVRRLVMPLVPEG